jgi:hypothetical protein
MLVHVGGPDVVGALTLPLNPGMLQPRVSPGDDLGHCIGPVGASGSQRHIAFDHRGCGPTLDHDEVARVSHAPRRRRRGYEDQMHRLAEIGVRWDMDEPALAEEGSAQGGEGTRLHRRVPCQVRFEEHAIGPEGRRKASHPNAGSKHSDRAESVIEGAIDEHQRAPLGMAEDERLQVVKGDVGRSRGWLPCGLRDRRHWGKAPLLIFRGGKPRSREALHGRATDRVEPLGSIHSGGSGPRLELLKERLGHEAAPTASSSHSYPLASSSNARSLPPDFTIRPADNTCTWSGTM